MTDAAIPSRLDPPDRLASLLSLREQVALVAGGGRGIGACIAETLALAGATVIVVDLHADRADEVVARVRSAGGKAEVLVADLSAADAAERIVGHVELAYGRADVLVNAAGGFSAYAKHGRIEAIDDETWDLIEALNVRYVFRLMRRILPSMARHGGGSIVNISSVAGAASSPNMSVYGAAKAALESLTRTAAVEYGEHGIRVNAVAVGRVETPAAPLIPGDDYGVVVPLGRVGQPMDVATAVLFLASSLSAYINGQVLAVDGGGSVNPPMRGMRWRDPTKAVRGNA
ncbi:MAG: SDR family NAD(P)-dependent oxidoreductase [Ilumatobacteraceae bacterium]